MILFLIILGYFLCGFIVHVLITTINKIDSGIDERLDFGMVVFCYVGGPFGFIMPLAYFGDMVARKFKPIDKLVEKIMRKIKDN